MTTCYATLNCMRDEFVWCLDWREVCDGKVDCWPNPSDEENCEELEERECASDEYRCINGQCIPEAFLTDNSLSPDCLDQTDEDLLGRLKWSPSHYQSAGQAEDHLKAGSPAFRCTDAAPAHWGYTSLANCPHSHGTSSGRSNLREAFERHLLSLTSNMHITEACWATMVCLLQVTSRITFVRMRTVIFEEFDLILFQDDVRYAHMFNGSCANVCSESHHPCHERMIRHCPALFEFPAASFGWKQAHFVYQSNRTASHLNLPDYLCYDEDYCSGSPPAIYFRKLSDPSMRLACELIPRETFGENWISQIKPAKNKLTRQCSPRDPRGQHYCFKPNQFSCGKRCLSKHRLLDNRPDCPDNIDESYNDSCGLQHKHRIRCVSNSDGALIVRCLPITNILQGQKDQCQSSDEPPHFSTLCDGYMDYRESLKGVLDTDETHCERWQCNNQYTRCDGIWNCPNGADEAECFHPVCRGLIGHPCVLRNTTEFKCLPLERANDGIIDCFGATDERNLCSNTVEGRVGFLCMVYHSDQKRLGNQYVPFTDLSHLKQQ